jgi:hypothetical protein
MIATLAQQVDHPAGQVANSLTCSTVGDRGFYHRE